MLLKDKVAVVFGAGAIGGAVARAFAAEGATLFVSNRSGKMPTGLDKVTAQVASIDALDERAVDDYVTKVAKDAGRIDVAFNAMGVGDVQKPLFELTPEEFLQPIANAMRGQYLTTRAVGRIMNKQKSGVVLYFGGGGPQTGEGIGGFKTALDAIEGLRRQFAKELGPKGVRFVTIKTGGVGDTIPRNFAGRDELIKSLKEPSPMKGIADYADVGNIAVFLASDHARSITDTWVNIAYGGMPE